MDTPQLPVDLWRWLLALSPIVVLLVLLVFVRWRGTEAGPMGMFTAALVALLAFRTPVETLAVAGAKGVWDAIFILYVIWPALLLYHVINQAGGFDALRRGITRFSRNELFIIIALGWVFSSFLQGVAGFGTPIAVVAPLLVAVGVKPVYAVTIPLIAHLWARFFGTLGVGWLATLQVVQVQDVTGTAFQAGLLLTITALTGGFFVAWLYGRWAAVRHAWPLVLIIAGLQGVGQTVFTLVDPVLSAFLAGALALVALYPLSRWKRYAEPPQDIPDRPAMREDRDEADDGKQPVMSLLMSFFPYIVLTAVTLAVLLIPALNAALSRFRVGLPFPAVETGFGIRNEAAVPYSPFTPLTHPGAFLLVTSLVTWLVYRLRGSYAEWARRERPRGLGGELLRDAVPASVPVIAFHEPGARPHRADQRAHAGDRRGRAAPRVRRARQRHRGAGSLHDLQQHLLERAVLGPAIDRG